METSIALVLAIIIYNIISDTPLHQLDFTLAIATALLEGHVTQDLPLRLTERPFSERTTKCSDRVLCEVCRAKGIWSQTQVRCKTCKTSLHPALKYTIPSSSMMNLLYLFHFQFHCVHSSKTIPLCIVYKTHLKLSQITHL